VLHLEGEGVTNNSVGVNVTRSLVTDLATVSYSEAGQLAGIRAVVRSRLCGQFLGCESDP
jgi:hypothetical protein